MQYGWACPRLDFEMRRTASLRGSCMMWWCGVRMMKDVMSGCALICAGHIGVRLHDVVSYMRGGATLRGVCESWFMVWTVRDWIVSTACYMQLRKTIIFYSIHFRPLYGVGWVWVVRCDIHACALRVWNGLRTILRVTQWGSMQQHKHQKIYITFLSHSSCYYVM